VKYEPSDFSKGFAKGTGRAIELFGEWDKFFSQGFHSLIEARKLNGRK